MVNGGLGPERNPEIVENDESVRPYGEGENDQYEAVRKPQHHSRNDDLKEQLSGDPGDAIIVHEGPHQGVRLLRHAKFDRSNGRDDVEDADEIVGHDRCKRDRDIAMARPRSRRVRRQQGPARLRNEHQSQTGRLFG